MLPDNDRMMHGREELAPEDLLPMLPATPAQLSVVTNVNERRIRNYLANLLKRGLANQGRYGYWLATTKEGSE